MNILKGILCLFMGHEVDPEESIVADVMLDKRNWLCQCHRCGLYVMYDGAILNKSVTITKRDAEETARDLRGFNRLLDAAWEKRSAYTNMSDYIRRQDAITAACKGFCHPGVRCPETPCREQTKYLRGLPPADVTPVVHGRWEKKKDSGLFYCSECGLPSMHIWPYCEQCGAKMDDKRKE